MKIKLRNDDPTSGQFLSYSLSHSFCSHLCCGNPSHVGLMQYTTFILRLCIGYSNNNRGICVSSIMPSLNSRWILQYAFDHRPPSWLITMPLHTQFVDWNNFRRIHPPLSSVLCLLCSVFFFSIKCCSFFSQSVTVVIVAKVLSFNSPHHTFPKCLAYFSAYFAHLRCWFLW